MPIYVPAPGGTPTIPDASVTEVKLGSSSVTDEKIAWGTVGPDASSVDSDEIVEWDPSGPQVEPPLPSGLFRIPSPISSGSDNFQLSNADVQANVRDDDGFSVILNYEHGLSDIPSYLGNIFGGGEGSTIATRGWAMRTTISGTMQLIWRSEDGTTWYTSTLLNTTMSEPRSARRWIRVDFVNEDAGNGGNSSFTWYESFDPDDTPRASVNWGTALYTDNEALVHNIGWGTQGLGIGDRPGNEASATSRQFVGDIGYAEILDSLGASVFVADFRVIANDAESFSSAAGTVTRSNRPEDGPHGRVVNNLATGKWVAIDTSTGQITHRWEDGAWVVVVEPPPKINGALSFVPGIDPTGFTTTAMVADTAYLFPWREERDLFIETATIKIDAAVPGSTVYAHLVEIDNDEFGGTSMGSTATVVSSWSISGAAATGVGTILNYTTVPGRTYGWLLISDGAPSVRLAHGAYKDLPTRTSWLLAYPYLSSGSFTAGLLSGVLGGTWATVANTSGAPSPVEVKEGL